MITVEKDANAEEMFIHASPEDLTEFAKQLWAISQRAETKGKHKEQLTASGDDAWLSHCNAVCKLHKDCKGFAFFDASDGVSPPTVWGKDA